MPKLNREEIVAAITAKKLQIVSIDTSVFYSKNRNFRDATLTLLGQFKGGPVQVVVSEIVSREMKMRLSYDARETQIALKSALRKMNITWNRPHDDVEKEKLFLSLIPEEYAEAEFNLFQSQVGFEVIGLNEGKPSLTELFEKFFSSNPPFGKSEARKHEFPDAVALLGLENYAKENDSLILCVAQDKGWLDFAEQSSHVVCFHPLEAVLAVFNEVSQHQNLADSIVDVWRRDGSESFENVVREPITSSLDMLNFEIDADCNFYFEAEPIEASLIEVSIALSTKPIVIAADRETVSFTLEVNTVVDLGVEFTFFLLFDLDDDWKEIGRDSIYQTFDKATSVVFVAERDISNGVKLLKVEVSREPILANFGRIEAFAGEDPTFEKY